MEAAVQWPSDMAFLQLVSVCYCNRLDVKSNQLSVDRDSQFLELGMRTSKRNKKPTVRSFETDLEEKPEEERIRMAAKNRER